MSQSQNQLTWQLLIEGSVQGVGYRRYAQRKAQELGLGGWTQNLIDGRVKVCVSGELGMLERYLLELKKGPPHGKVQQILRTETEFEAFNGFFIRRD